MSPPTKPSTVGKTVEVPASRAEALDYVGAMLTELHRIAERHRCDALGYIVGMAILEVEMLKVRG